MRKDDQSLARYNTVVKSNELIQRSRFSLSVQQQKIVLYLISRISQYDTDFQEYEFSILDFCKVCGIDYKSGKNYQDIKKAIKGVADKSVWVRLEDGRETLVRWIEKPYIDRRSGIVRVRFDKDMKPFLLQLKENFTKYELFWTLRFKSKYSIRLYELIKSIHFSEMGRYEKRYTLDELRKLLDAEKYQRYQHFKERVLLKAVDEINEYSDKNLSFEPVMRGHSVHSIIFTIETKSATERTQLMVDESEFDWV